MQEIFKCPFCGWQDYLRVDKCPRDGKKKYYVTCPQCKANGPEMDTEKEAVEAWNLGVPK